MAAPPSQFIALQAIDVLKETISGWVHKVGNVDIIVKLPLEINGKQSTAESASMQIYACLWYFEF